MIEQIEKQQLGARAISTRIRRAIETGTFSDGDQLPPERELANTYCASRSTVRNALNLLEEGGFVSRKVGSGTYVTFTGGDEPDVTDVIDQISPIQLIDARIGIERQMARLAVIHATRRDLDIMQNILERMISSEKDKNEFSRWDTEFHLTLARCTGNALIVHLYEQINEVRGHAQWRAMKNLILTPQQIKKYNEFHKAIYESIRRRDAAGAIEALNRHMDLAREDLLGAEDKL